MEGRRRRRARARGRPWARAAPAWSAHTGAQPAYRGGGRPIVTQARAALRARRSRARRAELAPSIWCACSPRASAASPPRAVTLEAACAYGARRTADAQAAATRLAALGLALPEAAVALEVEAMIGKAIAAVGAGPRHSLAVTGEAGARLAVDGRPASCALPCTVDLPAGDHVLAVEADGFEPAARLVRVLDSSAAAAAQPAGPAGARGPPAPRAARRRPVAHRSDRRRCSRGSPASRASCSSRRRARRRRHGRRAALAATGAGRRGEAPALVRELAYDARAAPPAAVGAAVVLDRRHRRDAALVGGAAVAVTYEPEVRTRGEAPRCDARHAPACRPEAAHGPRARRARRCSQQRSRRPPAASASTA